MSSWRWLDVPGIDDIDTTAGKVCNIACCHCGAMRTGNGSNLSIECRDRASHLAPYRAYHCIGASGGTVEGQYAVCQDFLEYGHDGFLECPPSATQGQQGEAELDFCFADDSSEYGLRRLSFHPALDRQSRIRSQDFRDDVRIEQDHQSKRGGSRDFSRGGMSSSTPPRGSIRRRMAAYRFPGSATSLAKAARRMLRASSSIDRPWRAARRRNLPFTASSRFRIVMLATGRLTARYQCNQCMH